MATRGVRHLPVVRDDRLVGMLSVTDVSRLLPSHHVRAIEAATRPPRRLSDPGSRETSARQRAGVED